MNEHQKEALETLRQLSLQVMLIAAGVFGIVGGFVSSSQKTFHFSWMMVGALLCFALIGLAGYVVHGCMIGLLNQGRFDPHNRAVQVSALIQVLLFIAGGILFVLFVAQNL